ncbi:MAG: aminotransferase class III-fold pyridoxal phosphate-dependent enzyme [Caldilineae bacterium]|nr:MAG: aminotransferase class III-fold pyridoxal phosphate-dependent enzyme [Caldilineae bacterium]
MELGASISRLLKIGKKPSPGAETNVPVCGLCGALAVNVKCPAYSPLEHGMMQLTKPYISTDEAAALAARYYGLDAAAEALPGEMDANFRLTAADGNRYVLKILHGSREPALVELQQAALGHLAEHAGDLVLPRVIPARDGSSLPRLKLPEGEEHLVWLLSYVPGRLLAEVRPHTTALLESLGEFLGRLDLALSGFHHPAARRPLRWDLAQAGRLARDLDAIRDPHRRRLVASFMERYRTEVEPRLGKLRRSVIHNDANDYNVLVTGGGVEPARVVSVIDFGDMVLTQTVCEVAIAAAYALLDKEDPLAAAAHVVAGYHRVYPLHEEEIELIFPLICTRLCVSVITSAQRKQELPDDPYVTISEAGAWAALEKLAKIHPRLAHYTLRAACGLSPHPAGPEVAGWLHDRTCEPITDPDAASAPCDVLDLSVGSLWMGADPARYEPAVLEARVGEWLRHRHKAVGVGRYDEPRLTPAAGDAAANPHPTVEQPTIHLGLDLYLVGGGTVRAPLAGEVEAVDDHRLILRHSTAAGTPFYTLYVHLQPRAKLDRGERISAGATIGYLRADSATTAVAPHLHFQIILDLLDRCLDFPHRAPPSQADVWRGLSPDPNLIAGIPAEHFPAPPPDREETLRRRRRLLGRNLSISYSEPLKIVRGWMQYLYDDQGRAYLDLFNNVAHVGHSHPRVVSAIQDQVALLNTNTRYLHDNIVRYAERLCEHLPEPLRVCFFVNSATEANELALRLARTFTGREDILVLEAAYHGHTTTLIDISPYKFMGPGGRGRRPWVHVAPLPDDYRGPYKRHDPEAGIKYARHVAECVQEAERQGQPIAAFIAESLPSVGGQIVFPPGYLAAAYRAVREAGAVCIADEVQVGFGRLGTHFWGFATQDVVPDIVVLGKPIGNGHPLAAVITTPAIADAFANGMEFFSTFGGNPVSCAAGLAVLDVLEQEHLQAHALAMGGLLRQGLGALAQQHAIIGDVRGSGLFWGIELVRDRETLEPATREAAHLVDRLRQRGILTGTDGPYHNVIKMRGPMVVQQADVELFLTVLDEVLREDAFQIA